MERVNPFFCFIFHMSQSDPPALQLSLPSLLRGCSYSFPPLYENVFLCCPTSRSSWSCQSSFSPCSPFLKLSFIPFPLSFLGPECAHPPHSAPPSYHHQNHYHYPQNPPASPALLVHTECTRDCPLDDTMHQSVLHMPHHLGTAS